MAELTQIADPALSQRNTLYLIEVVNLGPDLIESNELDHDLLGLLYGVEVGFSIVFHLMNLLHHRLTLSISLLLCLFFQLFLHLLEVVVKILCMVQLLSPEVPLEQSGFQPIAELYLFVFDH